MNNSPALNFRNMNINLRCHYDYCICLLSLRNHLYDKTNVMTLRLVLHLGLKV